jgi:FtsP/CotA-like multicopper oxidase with cupredoxin domain
MDDSFTTIKPVDAEWIHKGILGPILRAQVGDEIRITFKNNLRFNCSMHPHGVFYDKESEGAWVKGVTAMGGVEPNQTHIYEWYVPERAGPSTEEGSSIGWLYHSHHDETADTNAGLVGGMIIARADTPVDDAGKPTDVDKEFVLFWTVMNEGSSQFLEENIERYTTANAATIVDEEDFQESNLMHSVNGLVFNNVHGLNMEVGDKVRWHLMALGTEVDLHSIHFHALTFTDHSHRTDVINLLPASMSTIDTDLDSAGTWLVHCHVRFLFCTSLHCSLYQLPCVYCLCVCVWYVCVCSSVRRTLQWL